MKWLITGSSSGFGRHLVEVAAENGNQVIATARNVDSIADLKEKFPELVTTMQLDVTDDASIALAAKEAGNVDVLVNNAGIGAVGAIEETPMEQIEKIFDVNVKGVIRVTQAFLPMFREQQSGHIINISSVAGLFSMPGFGVYCASKHAVEALTDALGGELAPYNVAVTAIEPGAFNTKFAGGGNVVEAPESEHYKESAGGTRAFLKQFATEGAPGDPCKAAEHIYKMSQMEERPRRLPLGEDAWEWMGNRVKELEAQLLGNEQLTRGTNL
jgi:NADP-dependent 3-hydroxy acid dehydrogenase YdfG